jgi:hypothetical protein
MSPETIGILGIVVLFVFLASGMYIGIAMGLVGFMGLCLLAGFPAGSSILGLVPLAEGSSYTLSVIPLFVLMGQFAFLSGISTDIYKAVYAWLGRFRGGAGHGQHRRMLRFRGHMRVLPGHRRDHGDGGHPRDEKIQL